MILDTALIVKAKNIFIESGRESITEDELSSLILQDESMNDEYWQNRKEHIPVKKSKKYNYQKYKPYYQEYYRKYNIKNRKRLKAYYHEYWKKYYLKNKEKLKLKRKLKLCQNSAN